MTKPGEVPPLKKDHFQSVAESLERGEKMPDYDSKGKFGIKRVGNKIDPFKDDQEPEIKKGEGELLQEASEKYLREIEKGFKKYPQQ